MLMVNRLLARYPLWVAILLLPLLLAFAGLGLALLADLYVAAAGWAIAPAGLPLAALLGVALTAALFAVGAAWLQRS